MLRVVALLTLASTSLAQTPTSSPVKTGPANYCCCTGDAATGMVYAACAPLCGIANSATVCASASTAAQMAAMNTNIACTYGTSTCSAGGGTSTSGGSSTLTPTVAPLTAAQATARLAAAGFLAGASVSNAPASVGNLVSAPAIVEDAVTRVVSIVMTFQNSFVSSTAAERETFKTAVATALQVAIDRIAIAAFTERRAHPLSGSITFTVTQGTSTSAAGSMSSFIVMAFAACFATLLF